MHKTENSAEKSRNMHIVDLAMLHTSQTTSPRFRLADAQKTRRATFSINIFRQNEIRPRWAQNLTRPSAGMEGDKQNTSDSGPSPMERKAAHGLHHSPRKRTPMFNGFQLFPFGNNTPGFLRVTPSWGPTSLHINQKMTIIWQCSSRSIPVLPKSSKRSTHQTRC